MQRRARVTSKGQITIPHEIRRVLGVRPGDTVEFESNEAGVQVRPVRKESALSSSDMCKNRSGARLGARFKVTHRRRRDGGSYPRRILADFVIGAYAQENGYHLLTLDQSVYRAAFPKLKLLPFS